MTQLAFFDYDTGLPVLVKQPTEVRQFRFDFTNKLRNEALSSVLSIDSAALGKVAGSSPLTLSGESVSGRFALVTITGGTPDENYKLTMVVYTTSGLILEADGVLYVRES